MQPPTRACPSAAPLLATVMQPAGLLPCLRAHACMRRLCRHGERASSSILPWAPAAVERSLARCAMSLAGSGGSKLRLQHPHRKGGWAALRGAQALVWAAAAAVLARAANLGLAPDCLPTGAGAPCPAPCLQWAGELHGHVSHAIFRFTDDQDVRITAGVRAPLSHQVGPPQPQPARPAAQPCWVFSSRAQAMWLLLAHPQDRACFTHPSPLRVDTPHPTPPHLLLPLPTTPHTLTPAVVPRPTPTRHTLTCCCPQPPAAGRGHRHALPAAAGELLGADGAPRRRVARVVRPLRAGTACRRPMPRSKAGKHTRHGRISHPPPSYSAFLRCSAFQTCPLPPKDNWRRSSPARAPTVFLPCPRPPNSVRLLDAPAILSDATTCPTRIMPALSQL